MGVEIERKFLVRGDSWKRDAEGTEFRQGYLSRGAYSGCSVRIRLAGDSAWITIKGPSTGISRPEFEYVVPTEDARAMLALCLDPPVEKVRYRLAHSGYEWEVDEFQGANAGLVMAEIELENEDTAFERPDWLGREVSEDPRYFNATLAAKPFTSWPENRPASERDRVNKA